MEQKVKCAKCGKKEGESIPLVTIKTMTVRGGGKIRRYEALGDVQSIGLCSRCTDQWIRERSNPRAEYLKAAKLPLLLMAVAGAVHLLELENTVRWGLCILFGGFGLVLAVAEFRRVWKETDEIRAGKGKYTRDHMTEELAATLLPEKHEDAHLIYLLRKRVMDEKQADTLCREYGISRKKLKSIRDYLLVTPDEEANRKKEGKS